jgi:predicted metalloprotease with PDZ domain
MHPFVLAVSLAAATAPPIQGAPPFVHYRLTVNAADTTTYAVEMRIRNAPDTFTVAMAAHPEYDDRFWRFVDGMSVSTPSTIALMDSSRWSVRASARDVTIRYRIRLPPEEPAPRAAWRPFVAPTGALVGGPQSFLYIVGAENAPAHVTVELPSSWQLVTGMQATSDPRTMYASTVDELIESPIMAGQLHVWRFADAGVPYRVVYWPAPHAVPFDTTAFVSGIRGFVSQAVTLFGSAPWREYTFIFRDDAYGGLEHPNSVTLGITSRDLARHANGHLPETAHEFVHAWNLMRIRPAEYQAVTWKTQPQVSVLWFSEGLTLFYADALARRAGLPTPDPTRVAHLQGLMVRYLAAPGHSRLSAEQVSRAEYNSEPDALGDYIAGSHLQGELLGTMLDIIVRDATDGRRSMDDVMRLMLQRFRPGAGFMNPDVERAVEDVCGCDVTPFFDAHVRSGSPIDFNRYLALIGLRSSVSSKPALDRNGRPAIDLGVWGWVGRDRALRLRISRPDNIWGRAGLHTGDRVVAVNGVAVRTWPELRAQLVKLRMGERVRVDVERPTGAFRANVLVAGYEQPVVTIDALPTATEKARRLLQAWTASAGT